jgi:hypothetical protein
MMDGRGGWTGENEGWLGWEFRFEIPISGTAGIRNSASEYGIPELSGGKNPKIYGGNRFRLVKKNKNKAGTFFPKTESEKIGKIG